MTDWVVGSIILVILILAITYIVKEKKKGVHCIGCPSAGKCGKQGCSCQEVSVGQEESAVQEESECQEDSTGQEGRID